MQKITPHLWYDHEAKEAAEFYVSAFPGSRITNTSVLHDTPSGDTDIVTFELQGMEFQAISAGPFFKFNPSISFFVNCKTKAEVDALWEKLSQGGAELMELGEYPFSERYGWLQDKFGLSWQINYRSGTSTSQPISPVFLFVGNVCGRAEEAIKFWTSVFPRSKIEVLLHYGKEEAPEKEGNLKYSSFSLFDQAFGAMDSSLDHQFAFNEAISFIVNCENQDEIDDYWDQLSAMPDSEQCGWLKDKFGVSWQIVPVEMKEMLGSGDQEKINRVTQVFLPMKKLDLAKLREAYGA